MTTRVGDAALRWTYVSEGGRHAVFAYHGLQQSHVQEQHAVNVETETDWRSGRLLRVDKCFLARAPFESATAVAATKEQDGNRKTDFDADDATCSVAPLVVQDCTHSDTYCEMMYSLLAPYVDPPEKAILSWTFLVGLRQRALDSGRIPIRRVGDWKIAEGASSSSTHRAEPTPFGYLLPDYRLFVRGSPPLPNKVPPTLSQSLPFAKCPISVLTWELKPKAGYTAISPLVVPGRRSKFLQSRFTLLQKVYAEGQVTKGWMAKDNVPTVDSTTTAGTAAFQVSCYDPLDLFSGNLLRIQSALQQLVACPHNNLKVWTSGDGETRLLGTPSLSMEGNMNGTSLWAFLGGVQHPVDNKREEASTLMVEIVAQVLYEEDFLPNLLAVQKLDVIDADGAIEVYRRLVALCDGDYNQADRLVDDVAVAPMENHSDQRNEASTLLHGSPLVRPKQAPNLDALLLEISIFRDQLQSTLPPLPHQSVLAESRSRALDIVGRLSREECCYLLQTWLISLTVSDLSFFVTLRSVEAIEDRGAWNAASAMEDGNRCRVLSRQQHSVPGRVAFRHCKTRETLGCLDYEIKAIDLDRKPARKLRSRESKEINFEAHNP
jgi:Inositol-pentakisphosphate 2-kinase